MVVGFVGAAATKSVVLGLIILATATLFVPLHVAHPVAMIAFLLLTAIAFSLFGFIIGIWAKGFEQLSLVPALLVTRSEEHTSELQSLMRISYAVFCLKKKIITHMTYQC